MLLSVILPVHAKRTVELVTAAISSVLRQHLDEPNSFELVVVVDGPIGDDVKSVLDRKKGENINIVRVFTEEVNRGASCARNIGLKGCHGDIICYLDSDNVFCDGYLQRLADFYTKNTEKRAAYGILVREEREGNLFKQPFDWNELQRENFIDLNVYSHQRIVFEELGGFDEQLTRLSDWDLVLKYSARYPPVPLPFEAAVYKTGNWERITTEQPHENNIYLILKKNEKKITEQLRVLYVCWHFDQHSETYMRWELDFMRSRGVDVEVCAEITPASPVDVGDIKVHYGKDVLRQTVEEFKPHVIHVHWTHVFASNVTTLSQLSLPVTVRVHGFELNNSLAHTTLSHPLVKKVYLVDHQKNSLPPQFLLRHGLKLRSTNVPICPSIHFPSNGGYLTKNRKMILRVGAGLDTKDIEVFFEMAQVLPQFKFVLCLVRCNLKEDMIEHFVALNQKQGKKVDLRVNVPREEIGNLMREAAIYVHTTNPKAAPYGQPISIAESMACGCYVVAREGHQNATKEYVGNAGIPYNNVKEAVLHIEKTLSWTESQWKNAFLNSVNRAYKNHAPPAALSHILEDWQAITKREKEQIARKTVTRREVTREAVATKTFTSQTLPTPILRRGRR